MKLQMTFKRTEYKYLVTKKQLTIIQPVIEEHTHCDEYSKSTIMSLYFDTDNNSIVTNALSHPVFKEKLRVRSYGIPKDNDKVFIELKNKYDGCSYKRRMVIKANEIDDFKGINNRNSQIANEMKAFLLRHPTIKPSVLIMYNRMAYYDNVIDTLRITLDSNILYRTYDLDIRKGIYGDILLDQDYVLMEIKASYNMPLWLIKLLNDNNIYRTRYSKFNNAYIKKNAKEQLINERVI